MEAVSKPRARDAGGLQSLPLAVELTCLYPFGNQSSNPYDEFLVCHAADGASCITKKSSGSRVQHLIRSLIAIRVLIVNVVERIRHARKKRHLSKPKLSEAAGLSNAYVTQLERSLEPDADTAATIAQPGIEAIQKLAAALDVPVEWLAFGAGEEPDWGERSEPAAE